MLEVEIPLEKVHEDMHEASNRLPEGWLRWSTLLSVFFAVLAALAGLESAFYANDAVLKQIEASNQWNYYQAKGIKAMMLETEQNILKQLNKPITSDKKRLEKYRDEQKEIKNNATHLSDDSKRNLEKHEIFARAVTLFQIGIAIMGITILTRRRRFVLVAFGLGTVGLYFLAQGFMMP